MEIRLRYLVSDVDRHGNPRHYVRRRGCPKFRIKTAPGTSEFLKGVRGRSPGHHDRPVPQTQGGYVGPKGDTLRGLVHLYEQSAEAKQITQRGQRVRHLILRSCLDEETKPSSGIRLGECPTDQVTIDVIRLMRDRKQEKKAASANRVKAMRIVLDWGSGARLPQDERRARPQARRSAFTPGPNRRSSGSLRAIRSGHERAWRWP